MKTVNELLDDLAAELDTLKFNTSHETFQRQHHDTRFDKVQQLVGQIRWKLKEEQWKPR